MGIASMIIGIVAAVIGFIPICGMIALIPAIAGLALGGIEFAKTKKSGKPSGTSIAGIVLNIVAIILIIGWFFIAAVGSTIESV